MIADEDLHRHAAENLAQADALLFGRVTYEIMEAGWRSVARTGVRPDWMPDWMEPFARTIDAAKKYVVSSTLDRVDWNAEIVSGDQLGNAIQRLKRQLGTGLFVGGVNSRWRWRNMGECEWRLQARHAFEREATCFRKMEFTFERAFCPMAPEKASEKASTSAQQQHPLSGSTDK